MKNQQMTKSYLMIDTVSLKIKYPDFQVKDPYFFYPPLAIQKVQDLPPGWNARHLFKEYIQNPTREDKFADKNKPRLTIRRRLENNDLTHHLYVEFSIPKLLFGENLQEVSNNHFSEVIQTLRCYLEEMSVIVSEETIRKSIVNVAHFSKNIRLEYPATTVREVLNELRKAEPDGKMEVNHREYRNDGESLYFYTTKHNIIFYDKIKDMEKSRNISVDKNKTKKEKKMAKEQEDLKGQVLRMEVRYTDQKQVTKAVSNLLGRTLEFVTFEMLFDRELCRKALLKNWEDIVNRPSSQLSFKTAVTPEEVLNVLIRKAMEKESTVHTLNTVLISYALQRLASDVGIKTLRNKLLKFWSDKSCTTRLDQKIEQSAVLLEDVPLIEPIAYVQAKLEEFKDYEPGVFY